MKPQKTARPTLLAVAVVLSAAILGMSPASAQTPPAPTHTFNATTNNTFGTNTNWSADTLPVAGSQVLIANGKTASMTQTDANTLFGSLTLGTNSIINLAASLKQGPATNSVIYFNNGSQLNYTSGDTNRAATYNIVSGATAQMTLSGTTSGDSLPQGSLVGDSTTTVNYKVVNLTNVRWNLNSFAGTINYQSNNGTSARVVNFTNFNEGGNKTGTGTTNFANLVRATMSTSNDMNDSGTLQLTGSSGGASNAKFAMGGNSDTIGNFVIDSPSGATASAPTLQGSAALTVSGTTTFQGTAGAVNFDSNNGTPSSHNLLTTDDMTFGGTGTWAVSGDGRIRLNAASGTRTITTNTDASIANVIAGTQGFTKEGNSTLTLSGGNVYTGATTVNTGTLKLTSTGSTAAGSAVTVNSGAALGGDGTVGDTATFNNGSIFAWNLSVTDPGDTASATVADTFAVTGNLVDGDAGGGSVFKILLAGSQTFADDFWTVNQSWSDVLTSGNSLALEGLFTSFSYANASGTIAAPTTGSFSLSGSTLSFAIPEPTSALRGLLLTAGLLRRRRNHRRPVLGLMS